MKVTMNPMGDEVGNFNPNQNKSNIKQTIGVSVLTCVITAVMVGVIGFAVGTRYQSSLARFRGGLDYSELEAVYNQLQRNFAGTLDSNKLMQGAAAGMVEAAGDPHTVFFTREEAADFLVDLSGQFEGVGVELGTNSDGHLEIITALDDSPARRAGLRSRDVIAAIDDRESLTMTPAQASTLIRGDSGTSVKLTILRRGETLEFDITRERIANPSVRWEIIDGIGYMRISQFGTDTSNLARQAAQEFRNNQVSGVVLDLRGNGGGYVNAARSVASLWLPSGTVIVQEEAGGKRTLNTIRSRGDSILSGIRTVVLVDGGSASASEIVAGALQDHGAAKLIGTQTFGKGVVQQIFPLPSGAELKITIARWLTPDGKDIDKTGIKPDEEVEMTAEQFNSGNDTQLNRALEILR